MFLPTNVGTKPTTSPVTPTPQPQSSPIAGPVLPLTTRTGFEPPRTTPVRLDGGTSSSEPGGVQRELSLQQQFAQLRQDPEASTALAQAGIADHTELRRWANRLVDPRNTVPLDGPLSTRERDGAAGYAKLYDVAAGVLPEGKVRTSLEARGAQLERIASRPPTNLEKAEAALASLGGLEGVEDWSDQETADFIKGVSKEVGDSGATDGYVRTLLDEAGPALERAVGLLQEASESHDLDKGALRELASGLSQITDDAPDEVGKQLAYNLAAGVEDDENAHDLAQVFHDHVNGGGSDTLFDLIDSALSAHGKAATADAFRENGDGGVKDNLSDGARNVKDGIKKFAGIFGDVAEGAWNFGSDVVRNTASIVGKTAEFTLDAASDTLDLAGDVASLTLEQANEAVEFALENGVDLAKDLLEKARQVALAPLNSAIDLLDIEDKVAALEDGDSVSFGGHVEATIVGSAGSQGDLTVVAKPGGGYTVSGSVEADLGLKFLGNGQAGLGGAMEFDVKTPEEAARIAEAIVRYQSVSMAVGSSPGISQVLGAASIGLDDLQLMERSLSSIELSGDLSLGASVDTGVNLGPLVGTKGDAGLEGEVEVRSRLEFERDEDGNIEDAYVVREQALSGSASAKGTSKILAGLGVKGEASAAAGVDLVLTTRAPFEFSGEGFAGIVSLLADPSGGQLAGLAFDDVTTSLSAQVTYEGALEGDLLGGVTGLDSGVDGGLEMSVEVSDLDPRQGFSAIKEALQGDLTKSLAELPDASFEVRGFTDDEWSQDVSLKLLDQGVELGVYRRERDFSQAVGLAFEDGALKPILPPSGKQLPTPGVV